MCGIAGVFDLKRELNQKPFLERMASSLVSRGPDAEGIWMKDSVGFAHRRLRVMDLDPRSDQPMVNREQSICVVFNGEIYNYLELKAELIQKGYQFRTTSDTEVVVLAYQEWGEQSFLKLNGMFAISIADFRNGEPQFYLIRDRFGIKPLFYSINQNQLGFASDLRALLPLPWVTKKIDPQALFWYLKFSHFPNPDSVFSAIQQLEPGQYLKNTPHGFEKNKYWDWDEACSRTPLARSIDWKEKTDVAISSAVRRQLMSDVPVGCFVSGGIDSTIILSEAVKLNPNMETFTLSYAEKEFDESEYAKIVADHFGVRFNPIHLQAKEFTQWMECLPDVLDQPLADPTLIPTMILCQNARKSVTVALAGDGGDEMFFGYSYQRALYCLYPLTFLPHSLKNPVLKRIRGFIHRLQNPKFNQLLKALDILQFRNDAELFQNFIGTVGPLPLRSIRGLFSRELQRSINVVPPRVRPHVQNLDEADWARKIEALFIRTFLVDTVLAKSDRASMAFGLEVRVPFLDHEVLDLSLQMPFQQKMKGLETKHILRNKVARELPESISKRPKKGFSIPVRDWMRGPLKPMLVEYLNPSRIQNEGVFDPLAIQKLFLEHQSGVMNHSHLLWSILVFQKWNEKYSGVLR